VPTGVRGRSTWMIEREGVAMLRALAEQNALQVFAEVVAVTGNGLPKRSGGSTSIHYTATGVSRSTGLPVSVVLRALKRLTEAGLAIDKNDGDGWRADFGTLCRVAGPQTG
jgi:DNA-binding transcriptional ArsR family regulator